MAATLRHTARTLEQTLARLDRLRGDPTPAAEGDYRRLRSEAERQRWHLVVQREAIGFTRSDDIYEQYPLPPRWEAIAPAVPPRDEVAALLAPPPDDLTGGSECPRCGTPVPLRDGNVMCVTCGSRMELRIETFGAGPYRAGQTVRVVRLLSARPGVLARVVATVCVLLSAIRTR